MSSYISRVFICPTRKDDSAATIDFQYCVVAPYFEGDKMVPPCVKHFKMIAGKYKAQVEDEVLKPYIFFVEYRSSKSGFAMPSRVEVTGCIFIFLMMCKTASGSLSDTSAYTIAERHYHLSRCCISRHNTTFGIS